MPKKKRRSNRKSSRPKSSAERRSTDCTTMMKLEEGHYFSSHLSGVPIGRSVPHAKETSYRRPMSITLWLLIIGGIAFGVIRLVDFMKENDITFTKGEPGNSPITHSELALHNTPADCWVAFHGNVYDLTSYAKRHPGGAKLVTDLAGLDATIEYDIYHSTSLLATLEGNIIGPLVAGELDGEGTSTTIITWEQLRLHSTADDSWVAIHGKVYDLTAYANRHPGGPEFIAMCAGTDCTADYDIFHPPELLHTLRNGELKGLLETTSAPTGYPTHGRTSNPTASSTSGPTQTATSGPTQNPTPTRIPTPQPTLAPTPEATPRPTENVGAITQAELQSHSTGDDCWVAIYGKVYDLTDYANNRHPAGASSITRYAGTECTAAYSGFHDEDLLLETLRDYELIGLYAGR